MQRTSGKRWTWSFLALGLCSLAVGCAQQVGDIDRTQPNKLEKELFQGEWYMRQTVTDVPSGNAFYFTGLSTPVEKIRWEINEDLLVGHRSYELVPGTDQGADLRDVGDTRVAGCSLLQDEADGVVALTADERDKARADCEFYGEGFTRDQYKGAAVVAYPISSHFDVQRQYNASTGEQSNVLVENTNDRHWYERDYMRVTWHNSLDTITLFDTDTSITYKYPVGEEYEGHERLHFEYDDQGRLTYVEVTQKALVQSSSLCYYVNYLKLADCAPTEIEVVTSFARVPEEKTYEPVAYDNKDMGKFGFFREVRNTYDRQRGLRRTGQIQLPNRHNLWKSAYNEQGELLPLAEREPGHVLYYMNYEMPEALDEYNDEIEADWDRAFRRAAAAAKGVDPDSLNQIFILCHNPVADADHEACGERGKAVRVGDVRYNHIYWVHQPQIGGPLGYGPSGTDPETGEIISGTAYVYGASVDTYAASSMDIVDLVITCRREGEESDACQAKTAEVSNGEQIRSRVLANLDPAIDPRARLRSPDLAQLPLPQDVSQALPSEVASRIQRVRQTPQPWDPGFEERQMGKIRDNGLDLLAMDNTMLRDLTQGQYRDLSEVPDEVLEQIRPANWLSAQSIKNFGELRTRHFAENNIMHTEFVDDVVVGLALTLASQAEKLDEEEREAFIYQRLRGLIYRGVMAHEVGHTLGLRHNFQGSYDSLNYFPEYWKLRQETLRPIQFVSDLYESSQPTANQIEGRVMEGGEVVEVLPAGIAEYGYSSIMDYGLQFNTDLRGIGKYDEAAIIYAYTSGFDGNTDQEGRPVKSKGYVEVWDNTAFRAANELGDNDVDTRDVLLQLDDIGSLAYTHPLDGFHYTNLARGFRSVEDISQSRKLVKFEQVLAAREANEENREVEVPYMFCTDDWVGADSSCHRWDAGADPFEQVRYVVDRYHNYYWFNNFARDSLEWSASDNINRTFSRYLSYVTNVYQNLFFTSSYDGIQSTYRQMAAWSGLNLVNEILMTPTYGEHVMDLNSNSLVSCFARTTDPWCERSDGEIIQNVACENIYCEAGEEFCVCDDEGCSVEGVTDSTSDRCGRDDIAEFVPRGQGRYPFTRYDYDSGHEYYYWANESGHFYDFLAAVLALSSSQAVVRDVDVQTDFVAYSLPYYLVFPQELDRMVGSIWMNQSSGYGPVMTKEGEMVVRPLATMDFGGGAIDPLTGMRVDATRTPVDLGEVTSITPYHSWSQRYYPMLYGMASFTSNYSLQFVDNNHIFRLGNGEQVEVGEGFELATCTDPFQGHTYGALKHSNPARQSTAYKMIEECQRLVQLRAQTRNPNLINELSNDIINHIERLNMMRGFYNVFGSAL